MFFYCFRSWEPNRCDQLYKQWTTAFTSHWLRIVFGELKNFHRGQFCWRFSVVMLWWFPRYLTLNRGVSNVNLPQIGSTCDIVRLLCNRDATNTKMLYRKHLLCSIEYDFDDKRLISKDLFENSKKGEILLCFWNVCPYQFFVVVQRGLKRCYFSWLKPHSHCSIFFTRTGRNISVFVRAFTLLKNENGAVPTDLKRSENAIPLAIHNAIKF